MFGLARAGGTKSKQAIEPVKPHQSPESQRLPAGRPRSRKNSPENGSGWSGFQPAKCRKSSVAQLDQADERKRERGVLLKPSSCHPSTSPLPPLPSSSSSSPHTPSSSSSLPARRIGGVARPSSGSDRLATPGRGSVSRAGRSREPTDRLARTHLWTQEKKNASTEIHTHFLESFHTPKPNTDL